MRFGTTPKIYIYLASSLVWFLSPNLSFAAEQWFIPTPASHQSKPYADDREAQQYAAQDIADED